MKVAIVGYGVEGKAAAAYFAPKGNEITVCDKMQKKVESAKIYTCFGPSYLDDLSRFDLIIRSPGVPYLTKKFDAVRPKLTSLTKYFLEKCPCQIVGVTGTKGKGTTASLIFEILKKAYAKNKKRRVFLGGNIGTPPLEFLDSLTADDLVVLELSSFQLQDTSVSPHVAVVLGITPDHLNHHRDMEEYKEAKKNILRFQEKDDIAVLDADNALSATFAEATKAHVYNVSIQHEVEKGGFVKMKKLFVRQEKTTTLVGERADIRLVGEHNVKNILAAATAACIFGVPVETVTKVIREWKGLPHRLEFVKEVDGVRFYNDSASTNPETAIAAIRSFHTPLILILGGSDKNADFSPLAREIAKHPTMKTVILMGETKPALEKSIEMSISAEGERITPLEIITAESYQEAFMVAKVIAQRGDTVLLSPACASFDMFSNYMERGDIFRNFVTDSGE